MTETLLPSEAEILNAAKVIRKHVPLGDWTKEGGVSFGHNKDANFLRINFPDTVAGKSYRFFRFDDATDFLKFCQEGVKFFSSVTASQENNYGSEAFLSFDKENSPEDIKLINQANAILESHPLKQSIGTSHKGSTVIVVQTNHY